MDNKPTKSKVTMTISKDLHKDFKHLAISLDTTMSDMLEQYIKALKINKSVYTAIQNTVNTGNCIKNKKNRG